MRKFKGRKNCVLVENIFSAKLSKKFGCDSVESLEILYGTQFFIPLNFAKKISLPAFKNFYFHFVIYLNKNFMTNFLKNFLMLSIKNLRPRGVEKFLSFFNVNNLSVVICFVKNYFDNFFCRFIRRENIFALNVII